VISFDLILAIILISLIVVLVIAYFIQRHKEKRELKIKIQNEKVIFKELGEIAQFNSIEIFLGNDILPFDFHIFELATTARKTIVKEFGVIVPEIKIKYDINLNPTEYVIRIREQEYGRGFIIIAQYLAMSNGVCGDLDGISVLEPINNHCAIWIEEEMIEKAENLGYVLIKDFEIISVHLLSILKQNVYKFINRDYVRCLLELLQYNNPILVEEVKAKLSYGDVKNILISLLKSDISIRNLETILEVSLDNMDRQAFIIDEVEKKLK
jgi:flagellar biosynthesis protein FlhA